MSHISSTQLLHVATEYHIGQCRYRTFSSLQKILLAKPGLGYVAVTNTTEISEV